MIFLRRFVYHFAGAFHKILILVLPIVFALSLLLSSPKYIEHALQQSRVYDQFVSTVIDNSQKDSTDADTKKVLADPDIKAAAEKSFPPTLLQASAENVINGVFTWMHGKTPEPQFRVDLSNAKAELSKNIADYAEKRANSLPPCTLLQLRQLSPDIDLLQIPCLPPGVNVAALARDYSQNFLTSGDFLSNPIITNQTIAQNNGGKPLSEQLSGVPKAYSALNTGKWVMLALVLLLTGLLIFARRNRLAGIKHVAWTFIGVGVFLIINLIIYWFLFDRANAHRAAADSVQAMWIDGAQSLVHDFNKTVVWFSAGYIALGAGMIAYLRFRPNYKPQSTTSKPSLKAASLETDITQESR